MTALDGNWAGWNKGREGGERWRGKLPIPPQAHPLVRLLITECNEQRVTLRELALKAGCFPKTLSGWRYSTQPSLENLIACFNALGLDLVVAPLKERAQ